MNDSMVKTPWNRLLDLTCGWYQFVEAEETREEEPLSDDRLPSPELFDLYQLAGELAFQESEDGTPLPGADEKIRAFLNEKILPLLLRR